MGSAFGWWRLSRISGAGAGQFDGELQLQGHVRREAVTNVRKTVTNEKHQQVRSTGRSLRFCFCAAHFIGVRNACEEARPEMPSRHGWDIADGLQERKGGETCGEEIEGRFIAENASALQRTHRDAGPSA